MNAHEDTKEEPTHADLWARNVFIATLVGAVFFLAACYQNF